jgi:PIN domain nuclease of toxin-antitoxin system
LRLLLDTHTLIWWTIDSPAIPTRVHDAIIDPENEKYVSPISAMEIATKVRNGKLPEAKALVADFTEILDDQGFDEAPLTMRHALRAGSMAGIHKDPFDRMLAAQAILEDLVLISNDSALDQFGVQRLW